jgi:hypothetical protein
MLVIAANPGDEVAQWLANCWQAHDTALLTAADLSVSGWYQHFPPLAPGRSRAVVSGRELATGDITGVLTRMPCVYERELGHIVPGDRSYVASEMTAFLLAWLSSLTCPVLNRPTPTCLAGTNWRSEQWVRLAAGLGIPVRPVRRASARTSDELADSCEVIVVGGECFAEAAPQLHAYARSVAGAAGTELLAVRFTGSEPGALFVSAHPWPNLASPEIAGAVLTRLLGRSAC